MTEKTEQSKTRFKMFMNAYALPIATGATIGMGIMLTAYAGARYGGEAALKNLKISVNLLDSEGNPVRLYSEEN